jgi:hypothetical protein
LPTADRNPLPLSRFVPKMKDMPRDTPIRIGNAGGYWGDDPDALRRQVRKGRLDYITTDFLAEVTMSVLQKQRLANPQLGYATDFLHQFQSILPDLAAGAPRIISNAGGINPSGCAEAIARICRENSLNFRIAVVEGDSLVDRLDDLISQGVMLANMETGRPITDIRDRVQTANAYLGAPPVVKALQEEAALVITGRVSDSGLTAAIPIHEFGWKMDDWDRLAAAIVAGHILECGAQASGGNLTDWEEVPSFHDMGYPVVELSPDGSFIVTKPDGTGGLVNRKTITEQLIYEVADPSNYMTPDVVADFTSLSVEEEGADRVRVRGFKGKPKPEDLKVSVAYENGFKAHGTLIVSGPGAARKASTIAEALWQRLGLEFEETSTELVGYNACHRHLAPPADPPEILLRLGVRDPSRSLVEEFARHLPSLILNTVSGVAIVGARPRIQQVVAYWPCLVPARLMTPEVIVLDTGKKFAVPWRPPGPAKSADITRISAAPSVTGAVSGQAAPMRLSELCYGRSGDKGDTANIGIVARSPEIYAWLHRELTATRVKEYFGEICKGEVTRYEMPNLLAFNFVLKEALGGGGTVSLRIDPQGKTLSQALLRMELEVPASLIAD